AEPHSGDYIYGPNANNELAFGKMDVTINEIGSIRVGLIAGSKRVRKPESMGETQVQTHDPMSENAFLELIETSHPAGVPVRVLLFVHGFNVKFYEAALSAA